MNRARLLLGVLAVASGCRIEPQSGSPSAPAQAPERTLPATPETTVVARVLPAPRSGGLVVPVVGIGPDQLVDTFDDARSEGRVHDAIDIMAPRGTPVVAAAAGTVARVFESERGGLTVYVMLPDGHTVHYYAHLDAVAPGIAAGAAVEQAGAIGTVGSTGNASPEAPHLHFAVWRAPSAEAFWDGDAVNPYPLLVGR
ncbi:MAG TPA: M23 family metallopeptidase [Rubricoccaceae bacterium]|jgi:murein DD-endopeptidase MepM/ murein hydrolase activator NlpD